MWPSVRKAHQLTIAGEAVMNALYSEALDQWLPVLTMSVLPTLTAAGLPPDPSGAEDAADEWGLIADRVVLGGAELLWSVTNIQALRGLGLPLPAAGPTPEVDPVALRQVANELGVSEAVVLDAAARVAADAGLAAALAAHTAALRASTEKVPAIMYTKLETLIRAAPDDADIGAIRLTVKLELAPGSPTMEDIADWCSAHSGAVLNDAIVAAGSTDPESERMEKVWIATNDERTRPTHVEAHGQRTTLDGLFAVGSDELEYPCDPAGSPEEIANCRCRVSVLAVDEQAPAYAGNETDLLAGMSASGQETTMNVEAATFRTFTDAVIALTGTPTSDGRMLSSDIELSFRSFPLPLMWCKQSTEGHLDSFTVGVIEEARVEGSTVVASGYLLNTTEANEAADQIAHGVTGPSVDLAAAEWVLTDVNGVEPTAEAVDAMPQDATLELYQTITKAELIGTTLVATPAFGDTTLTLNTTRESRDVALVASAADEFRPRVYDHRFFENPMLTGPTLPTMGDDGRIYGHLACFGQCHRSIQSECVVVPRSATDYAHFHTSPAVRLDNGVRLPVGRLTVGTGHASERMGARPAAAHYDNAGSAFALVRVGEDKHGVWFSGVAAPWATPEQVEMGLSAPLSGDWRDFGSGLELVAALAVNTPGFSARGRSDDQGRPLALVASLGPVDDGGDVDVLDPPTDDTDADVTVADPAAGAGLTPDVVKVAVREALTEAAAQAERDRVSAEAGALLARAQQITHPPTPAEQIAELLAGRELPYSGRS